VSLEHSSKFQRVSRICFATAVHRHRSTNVNQTLCDVWPSPGIVHYIFGGSRPIKDRILPCAKFTLCPSLAFSYIGSVTARYSSSRGQPNFAAWDNEGNYGTFAARHFQQRPPPIFRGRPSRWAYAHILVLFSWPNLSDRRLDVCRTSTHDVALVTIWNAGLCCMRLAENAGHKNYAKIVICAPSHNFVGLYLRN